MGFFDFLCDHYWKPVEHGAYNINADIRSSPGLRNGKFNSIYQVKYECELCGKKYKLQAPYWEDGLSVNSNN